MDIVITPEQCRAARAWLGWQQIELAERANVSQSTVRDFEAGRRVPMANNAVAIVGAFAAHGVTMLFDEGRPVGIGFAARERIVELSRRPTQRPRARDRGMDR